MRLNLAIERLELPPVPEVQRWASDYDGALGPLIDLSQAVPGYPPHPQLLAWLGEAASSVEATGYGAIEGEDSLRAAYAAHVSGLYGAPVEVGNIHITSGCNQAFLCAALAVAGPGEAVLMTDPGYFNHETTLAMLGLGCRTVRCEEANGFMPDPAAIREALTPEVRALALVSPNNPTGCVYPPELLAEILAVCRAEGIWLILDETYRDFLPEGAPHGLLAQVGWEDGLILLYSFSKSFCIPGHRLGAITAGAPVIEAVSKVMDNLQICAPRAAQIALARAIGPLAEWRAGNRAEIGRRAVALRETMAALSDWQIGAMGAYFAWLRHPFEGRDSVEIARTLAVERGVSCLPGAYFGEGQDRYLRLAFANAEAKTIRLLADRLGGFDPG